MRKSVCFISLSGLILVGSFGFCQVSPLAAPSEGWAQQGTLIGGVIGPPELSASWAALGTITASATASGSLGESFVSVIDPVTPVVAVTDIGTVASGDGKLQFDARGLWLGGMIPVRLTDSLTLRTRGEYFVPFNDRIWASGVGTNLRSTTTTVYILGVPVFTGPTSSSTGAGNLELDASPRTRWFFVDAEVTFSGALAGGTSLLVGVRYDRLLSSIGPGASSTVVPTGPGSVTITPSASVTAELNSVSPYVGLRTSMGGPSGGLAFEVKGFPGVVFTSARYKNLRGYFGEFKAEYSGAVVGNLSGSFFLKGDVIHASFTDLTNFTSLFSVDSVIPPGSYPLPVTNSGTEVATSIHWQQLSVGGSLILNF